MGTQVVGISEKLVHLWIEICVDEMITHYNM